jgi:RND family efflux transporter MFP subunit
MSLLIVGCTAEALESEIEPLTTVSTTLVKQEMVEKTYISIGEVVPNNRVDLYANGSVEEVYLSVGDVVSIDEPILALDKDNVTTTFNATESQLRTIRDNLKNQVQLAEDDYTNQKALFEAGLISASQLGQNENQLENLKRQYNDARVNYANQLKNLSDTVSDRLLTSPIEGRIASISVNEGQQVNNQMVVSIVDQSVVYIKTFISSDLKRDVSLGDEVKIYVDGDKDNIHYGKISKMNEIPDPNTKLFEVHIEATDSYDYMIGEYTEIEYIIERYQAYMVPTDAIVRNSTSSYIFIVNDSVTSRLKVTPGLTKGNWIEITEINDSFQVVTRGQNLIVDGQKVEVVQ